MKYLFTLIIFVLFAWLGMWWYYSCDWCTQNKEAIIQNQKDIEAEKLAKKAYEDSLALAKRLANGLYAINEEKEDIFRYPDNIKINNRNGDVYIPESLNKFTDVITDYLGLHQNEELIISGFETPTEKQSNVGLGVSRANYIKEILVNSGLNSDRIATEAIQNSYTYDSGGNYYGGILLTFKKLSDERLAEIEKGIANKVLYSDFGTKEFKPDATLSNYTLELKNYLDKYPGKKVMIIGHTDDIGSTKGNYSFGLARAGNVMNYLISQGIPSEKLKKDSKGELAPAVPNNTPENRAKNRRIEIIVN